MTSSVEPLPSDLAAAHAMILAERAARMAERTARVEAVFFDVDGNNHLAVTLADGAAEAGALALASGRNAAPAARHALPGWARDRASVTVDRGRVTVQVRPPSPLGVQQVSGRDEEPRPGIVAI